MLNVLTTQYNRVELTHVIEKLATTIDCRKLVSKVNQISDRI